MRFGLREAIFVVLLLGMPAAAYFFVFEPRSVQIAEAQAEVRAKQDKLNKLSEYTKGIDDLGSEIDELKAAISLIEQQLPAQREVDVILREIWELAAKHKLRPDSVRPDKTIAQSHFTELPIKLVIVGDFDGFYEFMLAVEDLPRVTRMPQMKLKKLQGPDVEDGQMKADIVLSIFFEGRATQTASAFGG